MNISTSGDLGDIVALMGIVAKMPKGPHTIVLKDDGATKGIEARAHLILPLINSQPYCTGKVFSGEKIHWQSEGFRGVRDKNRVLVSPCYYKATQSLLASHSDHGRGVGVLKGSYDGRDRWLDVEVDDRSKGRVVVVRSARYHNWRFPWNKVVEHYGDKIVFVGLDDEYQDFCQKFGKVDRIKINDMLEGARLIAGCDLYIGNQTALTQVAEGLKHPRVIEVNERVPDVLYPGTTNAIWCCDGSLDIPPASGKDRLYVSHPVMRLAPRSMIPTRTQWVDPNGQKSIHFSVLARNYGRMVGMERVEAEDAVYDHTKSINPDWFAQYEVVTGMDRFLEAVRVARA